MKSVGLKDRRAALVQFLALAKDHEGELLDDEDAELVVSIVEQLAARRRGRLPSGVSSLEKRREDHEAPLSPMTATNLALYALDCISSVAQRDSPHLATAFRDVRAHLLKISTNSRVAPPPSPPKTGG